MGVDKPGPGEELNTGAATTPRAAATVIVLRGGGEALEVLLVKRNPAQRFMGGAWVFPGGAVDADEDSRVAGVREVAEEAAVTLPDPEEGDPDGGVPPGTPFPEIPDDWVCPVCGARKKDFSPLD